MLLSYYPSSTHLMDNIFRPICGEHGGILQSAIVRPIRYAEPIDIISLTGKMPDYHKTLLKTNTTMQYHLSGYGTYYEESLVRLVGEAIERYSLMASFTTFDTSRVTLASYRDIRKRGKVIPFEYISLLSESDYAKLQTTSFRGARTPTEDDPVRWIQCPSLFYPNESIWMPLQMMFVGYRPSEGEARFAPGFSTGTAAHRNLEKALRSALLEIIEIDALMIHWYAKRPSTTVIPNDPALIEPYAHMFSADSPYEVRVHDLSVLSDVHAHVFGSCIINKKDERPFVSYGVQGDLNPAKAMYRSFMEAMAIEFLGIYGPLYMPEGYFRDPSHTIADLDTNAGFWAHPGRASFKREFLDELCSEERKPLTSFNNYETPNEMKDLTQLIEDLHKHSEFAVYLDITPPETRSQGWYVMRAFIPELITMCIPSVPASKHPRWSHFGGTKHDIPHPLP